MILEKLKAGTKNSKETDFHGVTLMIRLLSETEIQQCQIDTQFYAKKKELDEESKAVEGVLRQLFLAVTDLDGNKLAESIHQFRDLMIRVDREYLVEEYLQLEADCMPSVPRMERPEFEDILEQVKKSPDSIMNPSNIATLKRLTRYLENQRWNSQKASGSI
jgi:hypothetical protein